MTPRMEEVISKWCSSFGPERDLRRGCTNSRSFKVECALCLHMLMVRMASHRHFAERRVLYLSLVWFHYYIFPWPWHNMIIFPRRVRSIIYFAVVTRLVSVSIDLSRSRLDTESSFDIYYQAFKIWEYDMYSGFLCLVYTKHRFVSFGTWRIMTKIHTEVWY